MDGRVETLVRSRLGCRIFLMNRSNVFCCSLIVLMKYVPVCIAYCCLLLDCFVLTICKAKFCNMCANSQDVVKSF